MQQVDIPLYILTGMLAIIAYFMRGYLVEVKELRTSIQGIVLTMSATNASCGEKHIAINARLKGHDSDIAELDKDIKGHDHRITAVETKLSK